MDEKYLYGRQVLLSEIPQESRAKIEEMAQTYPAFKEEGKRWFCGRCGSLVMKMDPPFCLCGKDCGYCTSCLQMGKIKRCSVFYHLPEMNHFPKVENPLAWQGQLSNQQAEAAADIVESLEKKETRLIWAVAGAGKTEMLFQALAKALEEGLRIAIASPRVDVCLELYPRIQAAFPKVAINLLYGGMEEAYDYRQITIATTHQLLRFKEAFDFLIIDEIDAFPFDTDLVLQQAAQQARKKESCLIYLSATPNRKMQSQIKRKQLKASILPARYHGYPLPVPKKQRLANWQAELLKTTTSNKLDQAINDLLKVKKRFLVFVPNIAWCNKWEAVLKQKYPSAAFACVHAKDPDRKEKVMAMRREDLDFLVSTTILERGVTFPNIDVLVVGACDRVFTEASLVQISGRVGRSPKYPTGNITFFYQDLSLAMKRAIKQIKFMNTSARKRGLLYGQPLH